MKYFCWKKYIGTYCMTNVVYTSVSVRPKGVFLFRPKPKLAERAIFLSGRNRYWNRKEFFVSAETDTETETMISLKSTISLAQLVAQKCKKFRCLAKNGGGKTKKWILCGFYKFLDILIFNFRCFPCRDYAVLLEIWDSVSYRNIISVSADTETETERCFTVSAKPKFGRKPKPNLFRSYTNSCFTFCHQVTKK